jgi:hypothetical protein
VDAVTSPWWRFVAEVSPGLTLCLAGFLAAYAPYALLKQYGRGRACEAIAYLAGLAVGLALTVVLARLFQPLAPSSAIAEAGLAGAFFGPFAGLARAKWEGPPPRRGRRASGRSPSRPSWSNGLRRAHPGG